MTLAAQISYQPGQFLGLPHLGVAIRPDHQDARVFTVACNELQQQQGRMVGIVEILNGLNESIRTVGKWFDVLT